MNLSRRRFIQSSLGAIPLGMSIGQVRVTAGAESEPAPVWVDKPMRWAQLTLVEDDPGKFDVQFWLEYFRRTRSDAVCLSAGGCVSYYPTSVPFHHRSEW